MNAEILQEARQISSHWAVWQVWGRSALSTTGSRKEMSLQTWYWSALDPFFFLGINLINFKLPSLKHLESNLFSWETHGTLVHVVYCKLTDWLAVSTFNKPYFSYLNLLLLHYSVLQGNDKTIQLMRKVELCVHWRESQHCVYIITGYSANARFVCENIWNVNSTRLHL